MFNKTTLWIALAVIIIVGLLAWFIYRSGKKAGETSSLPPIPGETKTNPLTEDEKRTIKNLFDRLNKDINDTPIFTPRDSSAYYELEKASDRVFIGVANLYKSETGQNLFSDMASEISGNPFLVDATKRIKTRAQNLKLL